MHEKSGKLFLLLSLLLIGTNALESRFTIKHEVEVEAQIYFIYEGLRGRVG